MALRMGALYDALVKGGVDREAAAAAAEEVADHLTRRPPRLLPFALLLGGYGLLLVGFGYYLLTR